MTKKTQNDSYSLKDILSSIKAFLCKYWLVTIIVIWCALALAMPYFLSQFSIIELGIPGTLGDTINGLSAPFLTISAIFLTYNAFMVQYRANKTQENWNNIQHKDIIKDRFESKLFHFIDLWSQQECMCKINGVGEGKQAFHFMFYEFKAILYYVKKADLYEGNRKEIWELYLAYYLFIDGASRSSIERLQVDIPEMCKHCKNGIQSILELNDELLNLQDAILNQKEKKREDRISIYMLCDYKEKAIKYFDGHRHRLVPFYRSLCMIIQYIYTGEEAETDDTNRIKERTFYLHILCSQLSEHELALLLIMYSFGNKEHYSPIISDKHKNVHFHFLRKILQQYSNPKMNCRRITEFTLAINNRVAQEKEADTLANLHKCSKKVSNKKR